MRSPKQGQFIPKKNNGVRDMTCTSEKVWHYPSIRDWGYYSLSYGQIILRSQEYW